MTTPDTLSDVLSEALKDIANPLEVLPPIPVAGPNSWDQITKDDFGNEFDFELYEFENTTVFYPVSRAALQWGYRFLPADCDRWRGVGFKVENQYIDLVVRQARIDKLVLLDDALHEEQEKQRQRS